MRRVIGLFLLMFPEVAGAQRWQDATAKCVGTTAEWSNKIEVADVDGDGLVDILVANGGSYSSPGAAEPTRVWKNLGDWAQTTPRCSEISAQAVLGFTGSSRTIKVADVDGDGDLDIFTGGAWQTQARLFLRDASGWTDASAQLPQQLTAIGDAEFGDIDDDGDLDLVIADWGGTNPGTNAGGRTRLYRNDGTGHFTDDTAAAMPDVLVRWSWDMELVDVDNDWDLDVLVSSKLSSTSFLFRNDGTGHFTDDTTGSLPHFTNNYEFEPMDIDGDGDLDLATINDGAQSRDHIFVNQGDGTFVDDTAARLAGSANPAADDNAVVWLDADSDGDADLLVASLSGADRLLLNDGAGHFTLAAGGATPNDTPGSLGIAVADLDGDGRLDVVQAQGEVAFPEKVQLATSAVALDTQPPVVTVEVVPGEGRVHARINDHLSPQHLHDFQKVVLRYGGTEVPMHWMGEMLWVADLPPVSPQYEVCATDRAGNEGCKMASGSLADDVPVTPPDAGTMVPPGGKSGGCCDAGSGDPRGSIALAVLVLCGLSARSRRQVRCSCSEARRPR